jgi:hypothetical protein
VAVESSNAGGAFRVGAVISRACRLCAGNPLFFLGVPVVYLGIPLVLSRMAFGAYWNGIIIMTYHDLRVAKEGVDTAPIAEIFD